MICLGRIIVSIRDVGLFPKDYALLGVFDEFVGADASQVRSPKCPRGRCAINLLVMRDDLKVIRQKQIDVIQDSCISVMSAAWLTVPHLRLVLAWPG